MSTKIFNSKTGKIVEIENFIDAARVISLFNEAHWVGGRIKPIYTSLGGYIGWVNVDGKFLLPNEDY